MIAPDQLEATLKAAFPDATVTLIDKTGMQDHYLLHIASPTLKAMPLMQAHRSIYAAVDAHLKSGALHAIELTIV